MSWAASATTNSGSVPSVSGGIVIAVILLLFPVFVAIGGLVAAAILGSALNQDAAIRNRDSELLDLNT
jgi:hypothetical protein